MRSSENFRYIHTINGQTRQRWSQQQNTSGTYRLWMGKHVRLGQCEVKSAAKHFGHWQSVNGQITRGLISSDQGSSKNIQRTYRLWTIKAREAWWAWDQASGKTFKARTSCEREKCVRPRSAWDRGSGEALQVHTHCQRANAWDSINQCNICNIQSTYALRIGILDQLKIQQMVKNSGTYNLSTKQMSGSRSARDQASSEKLQVHTDYSINGQMRQYEIKPTKKFEGREWETSEMRSVWNQAST